MFDVGKKYFMIYEIKDNCMHFYSNERLKRLKPVPELPQMLSYTCSESIAAVSFRGGLIEFYSTENL